MTKSEWEGNKEYLLLVKKEVYDEGGCCCCVVPVAILFIALMGWLWSLL